MSAEGWQIKLSRKREYMKLRAREITPLFPSHLYLHNMKKAVRRINYTAFCVDNDTKENPQ